MRRVLVRRRLAGMATWYPLILLQHLSCAIVFIGAVAFEVLVLESLHGQFKPGGLAPSAAAVLARARHFMQVVVALLFLRGYALFDIRCDGFACFGARCGWLLLAKVALAFVVLALFVTAVRAAMRGTMDPCRFRRTHHVVLCLMAGIVVLAKLMFY